MHAVLISAGEMSITGTACVNDGYLPAPGNACLRTGYDPVQAPCNLNGQIPCYS
jgi:hypothetical protein